MQYVEGNRDHRRVERQFFTLLRSGLWNEVPDRTLFAPGGTDWETLYRLSHEQTVVGLVTDGINRLPQDLSVSKFQSKENLAFTMANILRMM